MVDISEVGRDLCICVTDGGPGLPPDPDPDETPVSGFTSGPRHGLGLWIVNEAVAALAGRIAVGVPSDRGLSVQILLPLPRQKAKVPSIATRPAVEAAVPDRDDGGGNA
jgi:sensor histidine kinase regulating citrate/malate metabolism